MIELGKNLIVCLVAAGGVYWVSNQLGSTFIIDWLNDNILTVLLALIAVNIASIGVTASRLYDLKGKHGGNLARTAASLRRSILEQIGALGFALIAGTAKTSSLLQQQWQYTNDAANIMLIGVFVWSIWVLYDTTNSILILLEQ